MSGSFIAKSVPKYGILAASALLIAACGSSDAEESAGTNPKVYPAQSIVSTKTLSVVEWELREDNGRMEIVGFDGARAERVRMRIESANDTLRIDADLPKPWHLEYRTGDVPVLSGPIPASVVVALSSAIEDRPATLETRSLRVRGGDPLVQPGKPLLECPWIDLFPKDRPEDMQRLALALATEYARNAAKGGACDFGEEPITEEGRKQCIEAASAQCNSYGGSTAGAMANAFKALVELMDEQGEAFNRGEALGSCNEDCPDCGYRGTCVTSAKCADYGGKWRVYPVNDVKDLSIAKCHNWSETIYEGIFD